MNIARTNFTFNYHIDIHKLISCGAVFKRDFCAVCSLVILPLPPLASGTLHLTAVGALRQLAC